MWNKLTNAFNKSSTPRSSIDQDNGVDVMSKVYEQHPNLSNFYASEVPFPSEPSNHSPFKARKPLFRPPWHDAAEADNDRSTSPFKLPGLHKKAKSALLINTNPSELSLSRASQDSVRCPSHDKTPSTPVGDHTGRYGSLRSILRNRNTPSTGQNVRFFSRDVYRTISPNSSTQSGEREDPSFLSRLQMDGNNTAPSRSAVVRPSAREVFAPLSDDPEKPAPVSSTSPEDGSKSLAFHSLMMPIPSPDFSNIFDLSQGQEIPTITPNIRSAMLDTAVELEDDDDAELSKLPEPFLENPLVPQDEPSFTSTPFRPVQETAFFSLGEDTGTPNSDKSKSFTFGPVFHHPVPANGSPVPSLISDHRSSKSSVPASESPSISKSSKSRARALSDTVFQSMIRSASMSSKDALPEAEIDDPSNAAVVYTSPEPDPFSANATTYYTPGTMLPPTPPQLTHTRKASREEDMIWSLRTQLALQQDLCAQYEIDLGARDELVKALTDKVDSVEKEKQHRNSILRGWKKKVHELEKMCRGLEEEVDRSRQESVERSVMDEASGEALRELHRVIGRLEREKADVERRAQEENAFRDEEMVKLKAELKRREESERQLRDGIKEAKEQMEIMGRQDEQDDEVQWKAASEEERERHRLAELAWAKQRAELTAKIHDLEKRDTQVLVRVQDSEKTAGEIDVLKSELEAQWKHTESMTETISELRKERDELKKEAEDMEQRITAMEIEWNESENKKVEMESEFQATVSAQNELEYQLEAEREHSDALTQALHEREETIAELENERQYSLDNVTRLEENMRQRDEEIKDLSQRIVERELDAEQLREVLTKAQKERGRDIDEQSRALQEVTVREGEARKRMESLVTEKAEIDVLAKTMGERVLALNEELEKLRRQVHDLQQESADKEVKLIQFGKWRDQDKEDIKGLNIALDSKQQELEMMKRKTGVRGTGGSTPAPKKRESSMFGTPTVIRPPSALSDTSSTRSAGTSKALAKSVRVNRTVPTSVSGAKLGRQVEGSMGPPPSAARALVRPSASATPSRISSGHARTPSGSLIQSATKPAVIQRRASSGLESSTLRTKPSEVAAAARGPNAALDEREEKENNQPSTGLKRASMIAA